MGVDGKAGVRRVAKATLQPSFCIFLYMLLFVFSMCICTFACLYICMFGVRVAISYICVHLYICVFVYVYLYVCVVVYLHVYMFVYLYVWGQGGQGHVAAHLWAGSDSPYSPTHPQTTTNTSEDTI